MAEYWRNKPSRHFGRVKRKSCYSMTVMAEAAGGLQKFVLFFPEASAIQAIQVENIKLLRTTMTM
jgi:hypothetical protein